MRYKCTVSYDGSAYQGWQIQPNGTGVQEKINEALSRLTCSDIMVTGSGRTDRGVHALGQVFHVDLDKEFRDLKTSINSQLPDDIHIIKAEQVDEGFHARYDALWKHYCYKINTGEYDPLTRNYVFQLGWKLNLELMKECSNIFTGEHDFTSFNATRIDEAENQVRNIYRFDISEKDGIVCLDVWGNGFLRHMVRMLAGTLIEVGLERISINEVREMLEARDKNICHYNAPSCGLYLTEVGYESYF